MILYNLAAERHKLIDNQRRNFNKLKVVSRFPLKILVLPNITCFILLTLDLAKKIKPRLILINIIAIFL